MDTYRNIKALLQAIVNTGKIDKEQFKKLTVEEQELVNDLYKEGCVQEALNFINTLDIDKGWKELKKEIYPTKKPVSLWKTIMKYAAVFVGIIGLLYLVQNGITSDSEVQTPEESITLKSEKGDIQIIDTHKEQQIVSDDGRLLGTQKGNKICYDSDARIEKLVYNELQIPYGKRFLLKLSDGTMVHINSGTTLKYPVKFIKGSKREVFIKGEAYFKVAKDSLHPFIVNTKCVAVEVLGTTFNISAYSEDTEVGTVLVEGAISMYDLTSPEKRYALAPGDKGTWNKIKKSIHSEKVDTKLYTGWIDGELIFRRCPFNDMIKKLERSYNVSIENNNTELGNKKFNAGFHIDIESIEDVLDAISDLYPFSYRITNGHIVIP